MGRTSLPSNLRVAPSAAPVNNCGPRSTARLNKQQQACGVSDTHLDTGRLEAALASSAVNPTFVFEPILNNYRSKGFNRERLSGDTYASVFLCVYTDEGLASK